MIETLQGRVERERAEARYREERIRAYEKKMGVELPYSPVNVSVRQPEPALESNAPDVRPIEVPLESNKPVRGMAQSNVIGRPKFDKKAYQREYMRKRRARK